MSMMMTPDQAPGLPIPPGGGGAGPMDALNQGPIPSGGGIGGLLDALQGGGGGGPDTGPDTGTDTGSPNDGLSSVDHIQEAMKHLMMALAKEQDENAGAGITKGMSAIQSILAGKQKDRQARDQAMNAPGGGGPPGPGA